MRPLLPGSLQGPHCLAAYEALIALQCAWPLLSGNVKGHYCLTRLLDNTSEMFIIWNNGSLTKKLSPETNNMETT